MNTRRLVRGFWLTGLSALLLVVLACGSASEPTAVDDAQDALVDGAAGDYRHDGPVPDGTDDGTTTTDGLSEAGSQDGAMDLHTDSAGAEELSDGTMVPDHQVTDIADTGNEDDQNQGGDVQSDGCTADNSPEALAARDGFIEVCADPTTVPDAVCGDGSPYKFTYRPAAGQSKGLLLYFRGGGQCSDYISCWGIDGLGGSGRRVSTMSNSEQTGPGVHPLLGKTLGVFYLDEATNPLRQYDQVHIAYCTGDAGMKNEEQVFEKPDAALADAPASIKTYFHGRANIAFALDTVLGLFPAPSRLVVLGSSAGSWASMASVQTILQRWSDVGLPVAYYGEGGIGVGSDNWNQYVLETVGSLNGADGSRLVRFAQFSFISDEVQMAFAPPTYQEASAFQSEMRSLMEGRAAANPANYRYFAIPGTCHTLAQNPGLFQQFTKASGSWKPVQPPVKPNPDLNLGETNLLPWLTDLIENETIPASMGNVAGDWETITTSCLLPGG